VAEDDRDATSTEYEAETESGEVAADSTNDPLMIVSSREENEMENVIKIIFTVRYVLHP